MLCYFVQRLIEAYLGDGLSSGDAERLRRHCARCPACARSLREAEAAAALVATLPRLSLPEDQVGDLLARVRAGGQQRLGERLLGTVGVRPNPVPTARERLGQRWDALRHSAVLLSFRALSQPFALTAYATVPVAALLLAMFYGGVPRKNARYSTFSMPPNAPLVHEAGPPRSRPDFPTAPDAGERVAPPMSAVPPAGSSPVAPPGGSAASEAAPVRRRKERPRAAATARNVPAPAATLPPPPAAPALSDSPRTTPSARPHDVVAVESPAVPSRLEARDRVDLAQRDAPPNTAARPNAGSGGAAMAAEAMVAMRGEALPRESAPSGLAAPEPPAGAAAAMRSVAKVTMSEPAAEAAPSAEALDAEAEAWRRRLRGPAAEARAAARELARRKPAWAVEPLTHALREHADAGVREAAAAALAAIGTPEALAALRAVAESEGPGQEPARQALAKPAP